MKHVPVLLEEVLKYLDPKEGESYLDLTAGYGGHTREILARTKAPKKATLVDRDNMAVESLHREFAGSGLKIIHSDFLTASQELLAAGKQFDIILADLGVSSPHIDNASRGFSWQEDGPLDMRMDQRQSLTAEEVVNNYTEAELADVLKRYAEEPKARQIARLIIGNRPVKTTKQLAQIVAKAWPGHSKVHPATRTFQALRIEVNNELELLERALSCWMDLLNTGGRMAVISFHSLEDRIVKKRFSEAAGQRYDASLQLLTRKPVIAKSNEIVLNPRARSAKLRAAAKIKIFSA